LSSAISLFRIAALIWAVALLVVLVAEIKWTQRLVPDWLRNLSRVLVLVGAVGALTLAVLFAVQMMTSAMEARAQAFDGPPLDLSFESPDSFFVSLYLSMNQAERVFRQPLSQHEPGRAEPACR